MNNQDMFDFFNGLNATSEKNPLKDRMKTTIMRAKQGTKQQFIEDLARDYIKLSEEL